MEETVTKFVYLETFGCQMNDNDSERMLGFLRSMNYIPTDDPALAHLIMINTCSIREKAEQKVYSTLGRFKAYKRERPDLVIGVAGCVAQQEGERLLKRAPYLDLVVGPANIHKIKTIIGDISEKRGAVLTGQTTAIDPDEYCAVGEARVKAFVSIMRGCDNFCSYCIVPFTRGREVSRNPSDIIKEVEGLVENGVKEVTLLGQNVNSYGGRFPSLLKEVALVEGLERIRFVTSHPKDISGELMRLFGEEPKLMPHMHLPVQSGSDRVLERMRRGYTREGYLEKVRILKSLYPDMAITTDIIVGFPGEEEKDFLDTFGLIEEARFDSIFSFMYSPRPGTAAAGFTGNISREVKRERLLVLQERQKEITLERNKTLVGKTVEVLVEGGSKADPGELTGRTPCGRPMNFPGPKSLVGSVIGVEVTDAYQNSLRGVQKERSA